MSAAYARPVADISGTGALVAIYSSLRDFGTQWAVSLCTPKRLCKVVETLPCEICNAFAISSTSEYTRSRTLLHISSLVASDGRPDLVSSSKDVLLRLNSQTQNLTCAYDGAEDPQTLVNSQCIS